MLSQKKNRTQEVREHNQHHHQEEVSLFHQQMLMDLLHLGSGIIELSRSFCHGLGGTLSRVRLSNRYAVLPGSHCRNEFQAVQIFLHPYEGYLDFSNVMSVFNQRWCHRVPKVYPASDQSKTNKIPNLLYLIVYILN